jgi:hypothetical protein
MTKTPWKPLRCAPDDAVAMMRDLWDRDDVDGIQLRSDVQSASYRATNVGRRTMLPIVAGPHDQFTHLIDENPLWDIIRWFPTTCEACYCGSMPKVQLPLFELEPKVLDELITMGLDRQGLSTAFTFSICTPDDIAWMKQLIGDRAVVELGAGRGYWAWMLRQAGVTVHPYDPHIPGDDNFYFTTRKKFTRVLRRDHTVVKEHGADVLLMSWPGYETSWAYEALRDYAGDMLIYAGEDAGGCTADDAFYDLLESDWQWLSTSQGHMTWWGIHDTLNAYVRK